MRQTHVPGPKSYLFNPVTLWSKYSYYLRSKDAETETQGG